MRISRLLPFCFLLSACGGDAGAPDQTGDPEALALGTAPEYTPPAVIDRIILNRIILNALTSNAISANRAAVVAVTAVPLARASFDDRAGHVALRFQLHDELTREFMRYVASCALKPEQSLEYFDTLAGGRRHVFPGSMGLASEWASGPLSAAGQELVSACLLSRNNAFGKSVMLSLHGEDPWRQLVGWSASVTGAGPV